MTEEKMSEALATEVKDEPESEISIELEAPEQEDAAVGSDEPAKEAEKPAEVAKDDAADAERKPRKRKGNSYQDRVAKLVGERTQAEQYALEKEREAAEFRQKWEDSEKRVKFVQEQSIASYEKEANTALEKAQADYEKAYTDGDPKAMAKAQTDIAKAVSLQSKIYDYKVDNNPIEENKRADVAKPTQAAPKSNPVADDWITKNEWIDPNAEGFDEEKARDVATFAENLAKQWGAEGKLAQIGTRSFFKKIDEYVKDEWVDPEEDEAPAQPTQRGAGSPVASGVRSPIGSPSKPGSVSIKLSPAEQQIAVSLNLRKPDGTSYTRDEALQEYARNKMMDQQRNSVRDAEIAKRR